MHVAVIILNYNGKDDTLECIGSVLKSKLGNHRVSLVIVDNASSDDSVATFRKKFPDVAVLVNTENLGFSEGNNVGINYALKRGADAVFVLNNDTTIDPLCIKSLSDFSESKAHAAILAPKIYFYPGCEYHKAKYAPSERGKVIWYAGGLIDWKTVLASHRGVDEVDTGQYDQATKTMFISGCGLFITRSVLEKIGMFDPQLYLYYEDLDLSQRALKQGSELWYVPQAKMWHKNAKSSSGVGSTIQSYYLTRNRLIIGMRYASTRTKLALYKEATRTIIRASQVERSAVIDFFLKRYGKRKN